MLIAVSTITISSLAISLHAACEKCDPQADNINKFFVAILVLSLLVFVGSVGKTVYELNSLVTIANPMLLASVVVLIMSSLTINVHNRCTCESKALYNTFIVALTASILGIGGSLYLKYKQIVPVVT